MKVLDVDPSNAVALKAITELRKMFEDLPPPNATRLIITDATSSKTTVASTNRFATGPGNIEIPNKTNAASAPAPATKAKTPTKSFINYDLADLVKPNRLVKNKLMKATENFGKMQIKTNKHTKVNNDRYINKEKNSKEETSQTSDGISTLLMPGNVRGNLSRDRKRLIEEI